MSAYIVGKPDPRSLSFLSLEPEISQWMAANLSSFGTDRLRAEFGLD
ncbi:hypothetical protein [Methylicorpusculum sp.]|nr:hypothetical protein [Methylicorpusculum sp.]MDO8844119.1 hypothetical protein [Methylicorpusculum sp.]